MMRFEISFSTSMMQICVQSLSLLLLELVTLPSLCARWRDVLKRMRRENKTDISWMSYIQEEEIWPRKEVLDNDKVRQAFVKHQNSTSTFVSSDRALQ